jgi:hypothetical protein
MFPLPFISLEFDLDKNLTIATTTPGEEKDTSPGCNLHYWIVENRVLDAS